MYKIQERFVSVSIFLSLVLSIHIHMDMYIHVCMSWPVEELPPCHSCSFALPPALYDLTHIYTRIYLITRPYPEGSQRCMHTCASERCRVVMQIYLQRRANSSSLCCRCSYDQIWIYRIAVHTRAHGCSFVVVCRCRYCRRRRTFFFDRPVFWFNLCIAQEKRELLKDGEKSHTER